MKFSARQFLGVLFLAAALLTLPPAIRQVLMLPYDIDTPCLGDENVRQEGMDENTRLAYCLSFWPFNVSGGMVYAVGTSNGDEAAVDRLRFRRDGETLYVNNRQLHVGGTYETERWGWETSRNPWLILTNRYQIRNEGLIAADPGAPPDVLFISGDVHQAWLPNPLGLILILAGMVLLLRGFRT